MTCAGHLRGTGEQTAVITHHAQSLDGMLHHRSNLLRTDAAEERFAQRADADAVLVGISHRPFHFRLALWVVLYLVQSHASVIETRRTGHDDFVKPALFDKAQVFHG